MQSYEEIRRVRDGLVKELWSTVATDGNTEHTELLARIDTLNWVLTTPDAEPQTVEGPAMTLHSLMNEDPPPETSEVAERAELPPTLWQSLSASLKRGTDKVIHTAGSLTPTEIIDLTRAADDNGQMLRMAPPYSVTRTQSTEP